jgi:hypothetical protein
MRTAQYSGLPDSKRVLPDLLAVPASMRLVYYWDV